jgi:hypothetical protein
MSKLFNSLAIRFFENGHLNTVQDAVSFSVLTTLLNRAVNEFKLVDKVLREEKGSIEFLGRTLTFQEMSNEASKFLAELEKHKAKLDSLESFTGLLKEMFEEDEAAETALGHIEEAKTALGDLTGASTVDEQAKALLAVVEQTQHAQEAIQEMKQDGEPEGEFFPTSRTFN